MSVMDTLSPFMGRRFIRQARIRNHTGAKTGNAIRSVRVDCMDGDVANLDEIEGFDFSIVNQDLLEYLRNNWIP